jgi:nitrous oxide reductase accessory protein NosL
MKIFAVAILVVAACLTAVCSGSAAEQELEKPAKCQKCAMERPTPAGQKIEEPAECQNCGMDRRAFATSRVLITFTDGTRRGTCSINCAYDEVKKNAARKVKVIQVADYTTKLLIDGKKAVWVIGGRKQGVMSATAKWAFARREDAEKFVSEFGGAISDFNAAWKAAAD